MSYGYGDAYIYAYWVIVAVVVVVIPLIGGIGILCAYYCCCREACRSQLGSNLFGSSPPRAANARTTAVQNPNYAGSQAQVFVTQQQYPQQQYPGQVQYPQQQYPQQQYPQYPNPPEYSEK